MLNMIRGCKVPNAARLSEQYQQTENRFTANVSAEKIADVFAHFISVQSERLFFILELPANYDDEVRLRKYDSSPTHKDIYYIDGLTREQALTLLIRYGELLINDGISQFGFGVHDDSAELMKEKYNVLTLWTNGSGEYQDFFEPHDIPRTDDLITAWDTFSPETPGECERISVDGKDVFSLPDELSDWGIYLAEQREE